ncbi:unnamed protein product, partial [Didymodactylos carnosus]
SSGCSVTLLLDYSSRQIDVKVFSNGNNRTRLQVDTLVWFNRNRSQTLLTYDCETEYNCHVAYANYSISQLINIDYRPLREELINYLYDDRNVNSTARCYNNTICEQYCSAIYVGWTYPIYQSVCKQNRTGISILDANPGHVGVWLRSIAYNRNYTQFYVSDCNQYRCNRPSVIEDVATVIEQEYRLPTDNLVVQAIPETTTIATPSTSSRDDTTKSNNNSVFIQANISLILAFIIVKLLLS